MRFRNLLVYRLGPDWNITAAALEKTLAGRALQPATVLTWKATAGYRRGRRARFYTL